MVRRQKQRDGSEGFELPPLPFGERVWRGVLDTLAPAPQEARVLELVMRGLRDKQLAEAMGIGLPTVRTYLTRMYRRVGVADRVELILRVVAISHDHQAR